LSTSLAVVISFPFYEPQEAWLVGRRVSLAPPTLWITSDSVHSALAGANADGFLNV
jgi:hypothetical protein